MGKSGIRREAVKGSGTAEDGMGDRGNKGQGKESPSVTQRRIDKSKNAEDRQDGNDQVPLGQHQNRSEASGCSAIDRLKQSAAPSAMVNATLAPIQPGEEAFAVKPAAPSSVANHIIFFGPLAFQHRFGFAVVKLLFPIAAE